MNLIDSFNKTESLMMHKNPLISINANLSPEFLLQLLSKNPLMINAKDENGDTFLSYAIKRNNQGIINLLMSSPLLDLNYKDNNNNTYLHLAVICQNFELIKILMKKDIEKNPKNREGNTPLHFAYYINSEEIINLLIKNNCNVNMRNNKGLLPEEVEQTNDVLKIINCEVNVSNNLDDNCDDELKFDKKYRTIETSQISNRIKRIRNDNNIDLNMPQNNRKVSFKQNINSKKKNSKFDIRKKSSLFYNKDNGFRKISNIPFNITENNKFIRKESEAYQFYIDLISPNPTDICNTNSPKTNNTITSEGNSEHNNNNSNNNLEKIDEEKNNNIDIKEEKMKNMENINVTNLFKKKSIVNNSIIIPKNKILLDFLSQINLKQYYVQLNNSEFSNIFDVIEKTKQGHYINDTQLKNIGINLSGDRAKILIRIQEKSNLFNFNVPKEVYYSTKNYNEQIENDVNLNKLQLWLKEINLDKYFYNFVNNGYFSVDLLFAQMGTKNPLTDEILKNEISIEKLGYRIRILNKLEEEYSSYLNNLTKCDIVYNQNENNRICSNCNIF